MHGLQAPVLDDGQRYWLKLHPALGAGNFLHVALGLNTGSDQPLVWTDVPYRCAGKTRDTPLSLRDLKTGADALARWYLAHGVSARDPVGVYGSNGIHYLLHYIALTGLGAIPVLTNGNMPANVAVAHMRRIGAVGIVADESQYLAFVDAADADFSGFIERMDQTVSMDETTLPSPYPYVHDPLDPVMITHSSGTTGVPKPVLLQHGKWFHGIRHLLGLPAAQGAERYLSCLPVSHNAAIAYAMHAILCGAALMIVSEPDPDSIVGHIERFQPSTVVSFPSNYVAIAGMDLSGRSLDSVSTWINSGDAAHEAHIRKLVSHGHHFRGMQRIKGSQFIDGLGSSEMGHSSFRVVYTSADQNFDRCVGHPQEWVEACVLAEDGSERPVGAVGLLGVRSPSVTSGYWNDSLLTHRSQLAGYWLTGDLVYKDRLGCYYHVDRSSDAIHTVDGVLYSLQTEELVLKLCPELHDCTVLGMRLGADAYESPVALVWPYSAAALDIDALKTRVDTELKRLHRPALARMEQVRANEVSVGVTGKVTKAAMRKRLSTTTAA